MTNTFLHKKDGKGGLGGIIDMCNWKRIRPKTRQASHNKLKRGSYSQRVQTPFDDLLEVSGSFSNGTFNRFLLS